MKRGLWMCHFLELFSLSLWIGGMLIIGVLVAPAAFSNLEMEAAGSLMTRIFHRFNGLITFAVIGILMGAYVVRRTIEYRKGIHPGGRLWEGAIVALFVLAGTYTGAILTPRMEAARAAMHQTARSDVQDNFGRLHQRSETMATIGLLSGIILLGFKAGALAFPRKGENEIG